MKVFLTWRSYNNKIKNNLWHIKTPPFERFLKPTDFQSGLNIFSILDCLNIKESEFQQTIDLYKKTIKHRTFKEFNKISW